MNFNCFEFYFETGVWDKNTARSLKKMLSASEKMRFIGIHCELSQAVNSDLVTESLKRYSINVPFMKLLCRIHTIIT